MCDATAAGTSPHLVWKMFCTMPLGTRSAASSSARTSPSLHTRQQQQQHARKPGLGSCPDAHVCVLACIHRPAPLPDQRPSPYPIPRCSHLKRQPRAPKLSFA